jgi:short subunit dehydrogenase-like uncharacterized protein
VGRSPQKLSALGARLGHGLDTQVADLDAPGELMAVLRRRDVIINAVGSYARYGRAIVESTILHRASYIDCATEPTFIREVFGELGSVAAQTGSAVVSGFGHEYAAGNLAAALAIGASRDIVTRLEVGYFRHEPGRRTASPGTRASRTGAATGPQFAWRSGQLVTTSYGDRVRTFMVYGSDAPAMACGGLEHITIPRLHPSIQDVGVYIGGPASRRAGQWTGRLVGSARRLPGMSAVRRRWSSRQGGPDGADEATRARHGSTVVAAAYGADGGPPVTVTLEGVNADTFTAETLAWAAVRASQGAIRGEGALGPEEAFGLSGLREACAGLAGAAYRTG